MNDTTTNRIAYYNEPLSKVILNKRGADIKVSPSHGQNYITVETTLEKHVKVIHYNLNGLKIISQTLSLT